MRTLILHAVILTTTLSAAAAQVPTPSAQKVAVITLHGVGSQRPGWEFDRQLRKSLKKRVSGRAEIEVRTVYYHTKARDRQRELWNRYTSFERQDGSRLDQMLVRRLLMATVGDAMAYSSDPHREHSLYRVAQTKVKDAISDLEQKHPDTDAIVVVAHSLGCRVIFDYLRDVQNGHGIWEGEAPPSEFQQLKRLRLLVTTGCNLTFFESAVPEDEMEFFAIPKNFKWINYYDRDDPLGWPLRQLGGSFEQHVQDEERNNIGSVFTSHTGYWSDDRLNNEIADRIIEAAKND